MLNNSSVKDGPQEAEKEYGAALAVNPFDEKSECRLGDIAAQRGDQKDAYDRYSRAMQLQPNEPDANVGIAKALMSMIQAKKAQALINLSLERDPYTV